jgi:hypothetical protein
MFRRTISGRTAAAALTLLLLTPAPWAAQNVKSGSGSASKGAPKPLVARKSTVRVFTVETANLVLDYPDPEDPIVRQRRQETLDKAKTDAQKAALEAASLRVDPALARRHAEFLQKAFEFYRDLFDFRDRDPFAGRKITFFVDAQWAEGETLSSKEIRLGLSNFSDGLAYPPDRIYFHEMVHAFQYAQQKAGRYYIFQTLGGINEAFAEHFACDALVRFEPDQPRWMAYVDSFRTGAGAKTAEDRLSDYEAHGADPYAMDWGRHPKTRAGSGVRSGEFILQQMLMRIVDRFGWDIWPKFFAQTRKSSERFAADFKTLTGGATMQTPAVRRLFADLIDGLGRAAGPEARAMFAAWRFDLSE